MSDDRKLVDWIDAYIHHTEETEPPFSFRMWCGISAVASVLQRKCYMRWIQGRVYPNFYIVLVGAPGRGRKSTAMSQSKWFLEELGVTFCAEATTKEALVQQMQEKVSITPPDFTGKQIPHASLTIFSSELAAFFHRKDDVGIVSWLSDWYDSPAEWSYKTVSRKTESVSNMWINVIGATTPDLLGIIFPQDVVGTGLTSRMIFVYGDKGKRIGRFVEPNRELEKLLLHDLESILSLSGEFQTSAEFADAYEQWYVEHEGDVPQELRQQPQFEYYIERRQVHLLKLSMVICASERDGDMLITNKHFDRAKKFLEYTEKRMPYAFCNYNKEEMFVMFKDIEAFIIGAGEDGVSWGELVSVFYKKYPSQEINRAVMTLSRMEPPAIKIDSTVVGGSQHHHITWVGTREKPPEETGDGFGGVDNPMVWGRG